MAADDRDAPHVARVRLAAASLGVELAPERLAALADLLRRIERAVLG